MSILSGTAVKIFNFLGITATGQTTKSGSVPVTLASDQGALPVTDNSGSLTVDGTVTANAGTGPWPVTDNGGNLSIDDGGNSITVDGTVAISGAIDTELTTADLDTGAGTDTRAVVGLVLAASGGGVLAGAANPVPISDNGGSITVDGTFWQATQPVSIAAVVHVDDNSGSITVDASSLPLPTGAATEATVATLAQEGTAIIGASMPSGGTHVVGWLSAIWKLLNGGLPAALGAGGGLKVDGSGTALPVSVSAVVHVDDNSATLSVDDGGGSLTVDGTFWQSTQPVSEADGANVALGATSDDKTAPSLLGRVALTNNNLSTLLTATGAVGDSAWVSGNGSIIAILKGIFGRLPAFGTAGTASANVLSVQGIASGTALPVSDNSGSLTVDAPVGTPVFVRLSDGSTALATLPVSLSSVPSHAVTNAGTFAVQDSQKIADNAAFTDGTTPVDPVGFIFDETAGTALTENDIGAARMDSKRALVGVIEDATTRGQRAAVSAGGALKVDNSAVTQPVSGTITDQAATSQQDFSFTCANAAGTNAVTAITGLGLYRSAAFYLNVQGNTGSTLDIYLQWSPDGGTTWVDYAHFPQIAAGAAAITRAFTITRYAQQTTLQTVGTGLFPALAASTIIGGDWGDRLRVVYVNGLGTTLGKLQTIKAIFTT